MIFLNAFTVQASIEQVLEFHMCSANMAAITPPPVIVRVHEAPSRMEEGDEMAFTLWLGPLPIRWRALFEDLSDTGFVDRQIAGPFEIWSHRHNFTAIDDKNTQVNDEVHIRLSSQPLQALIGLGMVLNLPLLFAYRRWKTRQILERTSQT